MDAASSRDEVRPASKTVQRDHTPPAEVVASQRKAKPPNALKLILNTLQMINALRHRCGLRRPAKNPMIIRTKETAHTVNTNFSPYAHKPGVCR